MPSFPAQILIQCFMFSSVFAKKMFTVWTFSGSWMSYFFLSLNILPYITSICKVNFICEITRDWHIFIINWFIDNISRSKFYLFFMCKFMFYYLIPTKFFYDWTRQILCYFSFSTFNFFLSKTWTCPFSRKIP